MFLESKAKCGMLSWNMELSAGVHPMICFEFRSISWALPDRDRPTSQLVSSQFEAWAIRVPKIRPPLRIRRQHNKWHGHARVMSQLSIHRPIRSRPVAVLGYCRSKPQSIYCKPEETPPLDCYCWNSYIENLRRAENLGWKFVLKICAENSRWKFSTSPIG